MMKRFLKKAAIATVMCLSLAPLAKATPLNQVRSASVGEPLVVAQATRSSSTLPPKAAMYIELIDMYMKMEKMGREMMKSTDPETKKMGEELVKTSLAQNSKLEKMLRSEFLANPDK
jgi:hypothetical protein